MLYIQLGGAGRSKVVKPGTDELFIRNVHLYIYNIDQKTHQPIIPKKFFKLLRGKACGICLNALCQNLMTSSVCVVCFLPSGKTALLLCAC